MKPLSLFPFVPPCLAAGVSCTTPPTATLDSGPIFGVETSLPGAISPVNKFLGIPYAAPPERFAPPKPPRPWKSPLNATVFGPSCTQYIPIEKGLSPGEDVFGGIFDSHFPESEDCLYLNAFAPATKGPPGGHPVVIFIHGGGWTMGNGILDLSGFAGYEDIVALAFNYRTNIFGFPNSPSIPLAEKNLGLLDQQRALAWTQANAAAFGGDPDKVTVWGESAGSMSVDAHLHSYADAHSPPFRAAIMSSGQMSWGPLSRLSSADSETEWDTVAKAAGCGDGGKKQMACMRKISTKTLVGAMNKTGIAFTPVNDSLSVTDGRAKAWRDGHVVKVPLLMSTIAQEGRGLVDHHVDMDLFIKAYLSEPVVTRKQRDAILHYYRSKPESKTDFDVASTIFTDYFWQCAQRKLSEASSADHIPTWQFYFNISITDLLPPEYSWLGKFHGSDVVLLFATPTTEDLPLTPQLYAFANYFRGVIGRFVRNPGGGPGWPAAGSAYAPFDVASLGDLGDEHTAGATPVNRTELDKNCFLFEDIYPVIEKYSAL